MISEWTNSGELNAPVTVLVVDEDSSLCESCATILRQDGHEVTAITNGGEAATLLKRRAVDIAIIQRRMRSIDGLTLMRAALDINAGTRVIITSPDASVESNLEALREGAWEYLPKPFSASNLQLLVGRAAHAVRAAKRQDGSGIATPGAVATGSSRGRTARRHAGR
jgi:DNA-binding NtrC family response regulator